MSTQDKEVERMFMQKVDEDCFVDISQVIEHPPVALSFGNYSLNTPNGIKRYPIPIGTYGNFSFVSAPPKTKKTFFVSLLTSVYLSSTGKNNYGGKIRAKRDDKCVIHFDTEQGKFHAQRVFRRVVEMNDNENAGCYHTYGLRSIGYKTRIDFIDYKLRTISENNEIGLVVIDGIADLVSDVNSIEESNECIQRLMTWSEKYNCHIILCIHTNNGSEKPTGHLGSFAQKKCETGIILEKNEEDDGIITVRCKQSRGFSFEPFSFKVTEFGYPKIISDLDDDLGDAIQPKKEPSEWQKKMNIA